MNSEVIPNLFTRRDKARPNSHLKILYLITNKRFIRKLSKTFLNKLFQFKIHFQYNFFKKSKTICFAQIVVFTS